MCKHQIIHGKIDFDIPCPPKYTRKGWDYGKCDLNSIRKEINNTDCLNLFRYKSIHEMVNDFTEIMLKIADSHIPSRFITVNDKESSSEVRTVINKNKRVYKSWVKRGKKYE